MIILIHIVIYYCLSLRVSASECVCVCACLPEERKADLYSQWHFAAALRETDAGYLWVTKERILLFFTDPEEPMRGGWAPV